MENPIWSISFEHLLAIVVDIEKKRKIKKKNIFNYWKKRKEDICRYPGLKFDNNELDLYYELFNEEKNTMLEQKRLKQALDCNIMRIEYGESKKIIKLTTVPNECKMPEKVEWNDSQIQKSAVTDDLSGCRLYMIDFKGGVEFGKKYEKYGEVVTERERTIEILNDMVYENQYRLTIFRDMEVKNLDEYNRKTNQNLCRVGVFIDEISQMLDKKGMSKDIGT